MNRFAQSMKSRAASIVQATRAIFVDDAPTVSSALVPFCLLANILFFRHPASNFIFDEQEALLANPYVRAVTSSAPKYRWIDAFKLDFWGRTADATIGSYRPIPNLIWRPIWWLTSQLRRLAPEGGADSPLLCHWVNIMVHGLNAALLTAIAYRLTKRRDLAWLSGAVFCASAVLTEAVTGVVGLSDVLGGLGALCALYSLCLPANLMFLGVFLSTVLGLFSKESALCIVPGVPLFAIFVSQYVFPERPRRFARAAIAFAAALMAFVFYVELRKKLFHPAPPSEFSLEAVAGKGRAAQKLAAFMRWFSQPTLPKDALNNPLVEASPRFRIAGALRVFASGLGQVLVPLRLSGDYSAPQEPIPARLVFGGSVVGALALVLAILVAPISGLFATVRAHKKISSGEKPAKAYAADLWPLAGAALLWIVVSYLPVSNIPIVLPTVRAERFWYFPAIGTSLILALLFATLLGKFQKRGGAMALGSVLFIQLFLGFQCFAARKHANDYRDDLVFWEATRRAVPMSAKAHLNYSVMLGARGRLEERLVSNRRAVELQPDWAMANVYVGDTLCRLHRSAESVQHYLRGFDLGPNDSSLIALGLQCLWDEKAFEADATIWDKLTEKGNAHPGSWLAFLVDDTKSHGEKNKGVDPKYRPRGYNEGPKDESTSESSASASVSPDDTASGSSNDSNSEPGGRVSLSCGTALGPCDDFESDADAGLPWHSVAGPSAVLETSTEHSVSPESALHAFVPKHALAYRLLSTPFDVERPSKFAASIFVEKVGHTNACLLGLDFGTTRLSLLTTPARRLQLREEGDRSHLTPVGELIPGEWHRFAITVSTGVRGVTVAVDEGAFSKAIIVNAVQATKVELRVGICSPSSGWDTYFDDVRFDMLDDTDKDAGSD